MRVSYCNEFPFNSPVGVLSYPGVPFFLGSAKGAAAAAAAHRRRSRRRRRRVVVSSSQPLPLPLPLPLPARSRYSTYIPHNRNGASTAVGQVDRVVCVLCVPRRYSSVHDPTTLTDERERWGKDGNGARARVCVCERYVE